ncbi:ribonuclease H-like domain-containing protein [Tanacetum coccineum]
MADQDTPPPTITAMKIPIIKKGEYDIWSMRMRQYICHTDHNLWDIIVNGDLEDEATPSGEQSSPPVPKTAKQLAARRNQERIKSILLLAIPDEYLLKFHNVPDAKSLWAAIKSRFGGNEESKKMQKNVLKHQFENFVTASNETLDKAYDRFQKLISQLEIHGAYVSKEDINQKFLRSLPPSWSQIALIMRNKPDIDEVDIDDLYNNLRVYEDELKRSSGSNSASQNLAFLSSENTNSTNEVSTASGDFGVSTAGGINQVPSTPSAHDIAYSFLAQPTTSPQLENEDFQQMDGDDLEELDLRWQVAMLTVRVKKLSATTVIEKGILLENVDLEGFKEEDLMVTRATYKQLNHPHLMHCAQDGLGGYDWSNDFEVEPVNYALMAISSSNSSSSSNSEMSTHDKNGLGFGTQMDDLSNKSETDSENNLTVFEVRSSDEESTLEKNRFTKSNEYHAVLPLITRNPLTPRADISFAGLDEYAFRNKIIEFRTTKTNKIVGTTNEATIVKPKSVNETVVSKSKINRDEVIIKDWTSDDEDDVSADKTISSVKPKSPEPRVKNVVNTKERVVKPVWNYGKRGNPEILLNGGFVAFGSDPKGGKITGKGKIKTANLDFDDVYFVNELNFKLLDESQVVLRAPRKDGVYSLDLKNIVPSGGLEKQLNHNVKIIRCDNGTEFKNYVMNEFCAKKGIKREFSVARTLQQNGVAERKNRTLIEAARTMLADSLLPIPFWAEAVNTACYVLNRILGKFGWKSDEYQPNVAGTGPNWMFDLDFLTNSMNYIPVSVENQVIVDAGTQDSYVAGSSGKDKGPTQEYILLPLQPHRTRIPVKDVVQDAQEQPSENASPDKGIQVSEDVFDKEGQHQMPEDEQVWQDELEMMITQEVVANAMNDESRQAFEEDKRRIASQKKAAQATSTNQLSTVRPIVSTGRSSVSTDRSNTPNVSAASTSTGANADKSSVVYLGGKIPIDATTLPNADLPIDPNMPDLEDVTDTLPNDGIFNGAYDDDEDVGAVADFNNMDNTIVVSLILTLRIHKDYPKGQIL